MFFYWSLILSLGAYKGGVDLAIHPGQFKTQEDCIKAGQQYVKANHAGEYQSFSCIYVKQ